MKSISIQYQELKEGKMNRHQFLQNARRMFPGYVTNHNSLEDSVKILKSKGLLNEGDAVKGTPDKAPDYDYPNEVTKYKKVEQSPEEDEQDGIYPATTLTKIPKIKLVKKVKNTSDGLEPIKDNDTKNELKKVKIVKESKKHIVKFSKENNTYQVLLGNKFVTDFATKERADKEAKRLNTLDDIKDLDKKQVKENLSKDPKAGEVAKRDIGTPVQSWLEKTRNQMQGGPATQTNKLKNVIKKMVREMLAEYEIEDGQIDENKLKDSFAKKPIYKEDTNKETINTKDLFNIYRSGRLHASNVKFFSNGKDYKIGDKGFKFDTLGPNDTVELAEKELNELAPDQVAGLAGAATGVLGLLGAAGAAVKQEYNKIIKDNPGISKIDAAKQALKKSGKSLTGQFGSLSEKELNELAPDQVAGLAGAATGVLGLLGAAGAAVKQEYNKIMKDNPGMSKIDAAKQALKKSGKSLTGQFGSLSEKELNEASNMITLEAFETTINGVDYIMDVDVNVYYQSEDTEYEGGYKSYQGGYVLEDFDIAGVYEVYAYDNEEGDYVPVEDETTLKMIENKLQTDDSFDSKVLSTFNNIGLGDLD
jgi:hypothetical protein